MSGRQNPNTGGTVSCLLQAGDDAVLVERYLADEAADPATLSRCLKLYAGGGENTYYRARPLLTCD